MMDKQQQMPKSIGEYYMWMTTVPAAIGKQPAPVLDTLHKNQQSLAGWLYI